MNEQTLVRQAFDAREKSYSPYSNFKVGAALLATNGQIYTGCNIESAAYSPTNCAERTAFFKAVSEGVTDFKAIAIVGGFEETTADLCHPCGVCRQVMAEFCRGDFSIIMGNDTEQLQVCTLDELLPYKFGPKNLESNEVEGSVNR